MPKLLLVEDSEDSRDTLAKLLIHHGFDVVTAADGKQGVEMAGTEKPNVILMDMNLPEVDGWEATRRIKADPDLRNIPVIGLTAQALEGDRERALAAGCAEYQTKPIEFPNLLRQIEEVLKALPSSP